MGVKCVSSEIDQQLRMFDCEYAETDAEEQPAREHTSKREGGEEAVEPRRDTGNGMAKRYLQVMFTPLVSAALLG